MSFFDDLLRTLGEGVASLTGQKKEQPQPSKPTPQVAQSFFNAAPMINKATGFKVEAPRSVPASQPAPAPKVAPRKNPISEGLETGGKIFGGVVDPIGSAQKFISTPEGRGTIKGAANLGAGFFTSLIPQQSAGESDDQVARLKQGGIEALEPGETIGHSATKYGSMASLELAQTAVLDRFLIGTGAPAKIVQGAFLAKTGGEQVVNLPATLEAIQNEKDPEKQAELATEAIGGLALTAIGAKHLTTGLIEAANSPQGKALVEAAKNSRLADERGSIGLPGAGKEHLPTPAELEMGKALGMDEAAITKAKKGELPQFEDVPPPKEAGFVPDKNSIAAVEKVAPPLPEPLKRGSSFNEVKRFPEKLKNDFGELVNTRRAAQVEGTVAAEPFKVLDSEGVDAFIKVQKGERGGVYDTLRTYFDNKFKQLNDAGVSVSYRKDYLPQIWENTPDEIGKVFATKRLGTKPSFTKDRVVEDYQYGIEHGLTPKFETASDLVGWYETTANRAIANKKFVDALIADGKLLPADQAPKNWKIVDNELVPTDQTYKADPRLYKTLTNYLEAAQVEGLDTVARFATRSKNIVLGAGVPKTAINSYGLTRLMSSVLSAKHPLGQAFRGLGWVLRPSKAEAFLKLNKVEEAAFAREGYVPQIEDFNPQGTFKPNAENTGIKKAFDWLHLKASKAGQIQQDLIEAPTLAKVVPAMKLRYAMEMFDDLKNNGFSEKQARRVASKSANDFFGGINIEELGRSKDFQNGLRSSILAPDLLTSSKRTGGGVIKSLTTERGNAEFKPYRRFAKNMALTVIAANVLNMAMTGHWMFQNERGKEFEIATGQKDSKGKDITIPIFGSSIDFLRLPTQAIRAIADGHPDEVANIIRGRLSIPLGVTANVVTNSDSFGNPLVGADKYGQPQSVEKQAGNLAGSVVSPFLPQQVSAGVGLATGKTSPEEAIAKALELPVRFRRPNSGKSSGKVSAGTRRRKSGKVSRGRKVAKPRKGRTTRVKSTRIKGFSKSLSSITARR